MSVPTIARPTAHQPDPAQLAGSADFVRVIDGVDAPAVGPWEIGSGQRLGLSTRGLRKREVPARVCGGTLTVTDDLLGSSFDFTLLVTDTGHHVDFCTRVTGLLSMDSWQAAGTATTAGGSSPVSLRLGYNGVFRQRGRHPSLWLAVTATVDIAGLGVAFGSRSTGRLKIRADLNLGPGTAL